MRVISKAKLRKFWEDPGHPRAEEPLRSWYRVVLAADWRCPADVKGTYNTADLVGAKVVFDVGGNKYRLIAVIDYERHKVLVRHVLAHKEYDRGHWKKDTFGEDGKGPASRPGPAETGRPGARHGRRRRR
jgi:mRNA interferase HigB